MDNLYEMIQKADSGDAEAQYHVANYIIWGEKGEIEPDWVERAIDYYERASAQGNSNAMIDLGTMYRLGRGVECDIDKTFYWLKQAAALLDPIAYQYLGYALEIPVGYLDPNDETADYKAVFGYFFKGALMDDANCLYKMGDMYLSGKYVEPDPKFAFMMYMDSYKNSEYAYSHSSVCLRIGECYYSGIGTEQDTDEACEYLEDAIKNFEIRVDNRDSPEFFMEGYNRAKYLLKRIKDGKAAEPFIGLDKSNINEDYIDFIKSDMLQYPEPEYPIAELDKLKIENPKIDVFVDIFFNDALAAAEQGDNEAMYHVAFYCSNRYENQSDAKDMIDFALYYYHKAIRCGNRGAMFSLGSIYYHGDYGVEVDKNKAFKLYLYTNAFIAQGELGVYYAKGEIVTQDYEKAFKCFAKSALQKVNACYGSLANLATMYRKGIFVEVDEKFAEYCENLSKKAAENFNRPGERI